MKPLNTIKKGCMEVFYSEKYNSITSCGIKELCFSCQALLKQTEEIIKEIEKKVNVFISASKTKHDLLVLEGFGVPQINISKSIIDMLKDLKMELKSALIGEEKKCKK